MRAFQKFRGVNPIKEGVIWQESNTAWPFECSQCHRDFPNGGLRYLASSLTNHSHNATSILCPECKSGGDPLRQKAPKYAERRTVFD